MNHAPYPRPEPKPVQGSGCGTKIFGSFLAFGGVSLCCAFTGGAMMAEGPHGPHGEITADPNASSWLAPRAGTSLVVAAIGIYLVFKKGTRKL